MDKQTLSNDVQHAITKLQGLRDEIRLKLHLASLDIKQQWDTLDPQVAEIEKLSHDATDAAKEKVHELVEKLNEIRASLTEKAEKTEKSGKTEKTEK